MRKLKSIFLFVVLLLVGLSAGAYSFEVDGIYYYINSDQVTVSVTYRELYVYDDYAGDVVIPSSVTYNGNTYSVTSIGLYAFYGCTNLTSVTIPNSVTSIGNATFFECRSLTSVTIPNSVTSIGEQAFSSCTSLTSLSIPNSVTSIGGNAFYNCTSLTNVTIPNSVTSIDRFAFYGCTSLTNVTIGSSVTSIGNYAFEECTSLTNVTIGNSVTSIGYNAFYYCSLDTVICKGDVPPTLEESVFDYGENTVLIVPCETKTAYESTYGWRNFSNIVEDCGNTGIEGIVTENSIEVYPNPAKEKLTIKAENEISIFNNKGQIVKVIKNIKGTKEIDISDLQSGIYYIKTGDVTKKLIVE